MPVRGAAGVAVAAGRGVGVGVAAGRGVGVGVGAAPPGVGVGVAAPAVGVGVGVWACGGGPVRKSSVPPCAEPWKRPRASRASPSRCQTATRPGPESRGVFIAAWISAWVRATLHRRTSSMAPSKRTSQFTSDPMRSGCVFVVSGPEYGSSKVSAPFT